MAWTENACSLNMRRRNLLAATASAFVVVATQADALLDGNFQLEVLGLLARRHPEWKSGPGPDVATIVVQARKMNLDNIYRRVAPLTGGEREAEIVSFIENGIRASAPAIDVEPYAAIRGRLRPQILPADYPRAVPQLVSRPFMQGLVVGYAVDSPKTYQFVMSDTLSAWQIDRSVLEREAVANAEAVAAQIELKRTPNKVSGAFCSTEQMDGYDAARLLLPAFMGRVLATLEVPAAIAAIPNRDFLTTWTFDFARREGFAGLVERDFHIQPHPLTAMLFVVSGAGVRPASNAELADNGR